jgi:gamma-glutamyltranspeptidase/glutathione hydrolase
VAAALVLAVVDPAAAALGGGGACLVHVSASGETRALDFLPAIPPSAAARPAVPVPGSVRGLFVLASAYGRLQWWELVEPAARLARYGTLVDGRLAADLVTAAETLRGDRSARAVFFDRGAPRAVGQELSQLALAATLARLARYGPGDFYAGGVAEGLARGAEAAGMSLARSELAAYEARWHEPKRVPDHGVVLETVPLPAAAGGPTTSLAVADAEGLWVACSLGMGGAFGSGRMAENTGVLLAAAPRPGSSWLGGAAPALVREGEAGPVRAAGAGIGGDGPGSLLAAVRDGTGPPPAAALVACPRGTGGPAGCETRAEMRVPALR